MNIRRMIQSYVSAWEAWTNAKREGRIRGECEEALGWVIRGRPKAKGEAGRVGGRGQQMHEAGGEETGGRPRQPQQQQQLQQQQQQQQRMSLTCDGKRKEEERRKEGEVAAAIAAAAASAAAPSLHTFDVPGLNLSRVRTGEKPFKISMVGRNPKKHKPQTTQNRKPQTENHKTKSGQFFVLVHLLVVLVCVCSIPLPIVCVSSL